MKVKRLKPPVNPCVRCNTTEAQYPGGMCIWCDAETTELIYASIRLYNANTPEGRAYRVLVHQCDEMKKEIAALKEQLAKLGGA